VWGRITCRQAGSDGLRMLNPLFRTLIKVAVASLIVGTIMAHFGITVDKLMLEFGLSTERLHQYARQGFAWAWPNVLLGSIVIVPIWFVVFLFRPPGKSSSE
jgi:succinate dehydrogenase/fumarate reductase cytochrome b subunit